MTKLTDEEIAEIKCIHDLYSKDEHMAQFFFDPDGYKAHIHRGDLLAHITEQQARIARMDEDAAYYKETLETLLIRMDAVSGVAKDDLRRAASAREK